MKKALSFIIILALFASCTSLSSKIEDTRVLDFTYSIKTETPNRAFDTLLTDAFMETFGPYLNIEKDDNTGNGQIELIFLPGGPKTLLLPVNKSIYIVKITSPDNRLLWYGSIDRAGISLFSFSQHKEIKRVNERLRDFFLFDTGLSDQIMPVKYQ